MSTIINEGFSNYNFKIDIFLFPVCLANHIKVQLSQLLKQYICSMKKLNSHVSELQRPECECQHNTCGANCDHCCPLYNQLPWRAGTPSDGAQCEPCQCFGHATSCRYDAAVAAARLSQDLYGEYRGGGVCINCTVSLL